MKRGVIANAIQQWIDPFIPEQQFMLSQYLVFPQVDNQRRSIKIVDGIRQAWKSGRWTSIAPKGYKNARDEYNKPILIPDGLKAKGIKYMFEQISRGVSQSRVRKEIKVKFGLIFSRNGISVALRNSLYMGKIKVPGDNDIQDYFVRGVFKPLIPEELFYKVQSVLSRNKLKWKTPKQIKFRKELPLRGNLICSKCGSLLTGSGSRSKNGSRYFYYHCDHCKQERYPAPLANITVENVFKDFSFKNSVKILYELILKEKLKGSKSERNKRINVLKSNIEKNDQRLENLQMLLLDNKISIEEYQKIRSKLTGENHNMELELCEIKQVTDEMEKHLLNGINLLTNLLETYKAASLQHKYDILSSIFPEKLIFQNEKYRTPRINEVLSILLTVDKTSSESEKKRPAKKCRPSLLVNPKGLEPPTS
jgi:site-specific DNA recombinase